MREEIIEHLQNPEALEKLYRTNKSKFKREFEHVYLEFPDNMIVKCWAARLHPAKNETQWGSRRELFSLLFLCAIAGILAKLPSLINLKEEHYYTRNIGFIVFPVLSLFFLKKNLLSIKKTLFLMFAFLISAVYINLLPSGNLRDTTILSCIHLPLFLWSMLGFCFVGDNLKDHEKKMNFLRYNGDLIVMTALLLIAGGIMTGITIGLFSLIQVDITEFYFKYIVVFGISSAPIVSTYILQLNSQLVGKISPVIARIFSPLVLITLMLYLLAIVMSGKDPYNDRDFLILFNLLLIGVMALIFFSVAERNRKSENKISEIILISLSVVTLIINVIALSAILFRISEWGFTPNRLSVLGGNLLILTNLFLVCLRLIKSFRENGDYESVKKSIANFLPYYSVWTMIVVFLFPILFGFK